MILLVLVVGVAAMFATNFWVTAAQTRYVSLRLDRGETRPDDAALARYREKPWRWPLEAGAFWRRQHDWLTRPVSDPLIETARRQYERRQRIGVAVYVLVVIAIMASVSLNNFLNRL